MFTAADAVGSGEFYGAVGIPVIFDGSFAIDSSNLLATIPDSYCSAERSQVALFIGDCTQPNNQQAQFSLSAGDVYAHAVAVAGFDIGVTEIGFDLQVDFPSDILSALTPEIG